MKKTVNLRQVEAFYSVMRTGTVVGAAQLMNVTQPAVSKAIALLELRIGYKLFERRGRKLVATPEAEALYREIEPIYGSLERISQIAEDIRNQRAGALRIATLPSISQWLLPKAITRFLSTRPNVSVYIESLPSRQVADLVATRQFDVGLIELPLSRPAIATEPLDPCPAVAILPVGHRLASKRVISVKDLVNERLVLLSQHSFLRHQIDDAFSNAGVAANVIVDTPHSLVACGLVAAGAGVSLVSRWAAELFSAHDVVVRPLREELASRYAIIFPSPGPRLLLAEAFIKDFKEEIRHLKRR